jgi:hypothetical protein
MTRRRKIILGVVLVVVAGCAAWLVLRSPREPSYKGKSLSEWLVALNTYDNTHPPAMLISNRTIYAPSAERTQYQDAIRHMGTNAIPFLIQMLQAKDSGIKLAIAGRLNTQHFIHLHITTAAERRVMAVRGFEALGPEAEPAVFKLARLFAKGDYPNRTDIGWSLSTILPSMAGPGPQWYLARERPTYELSRDDLLEQLGPPDLTEADYVAYEIGNHSVPMTIGPRFYLYIQFRHDRVLNAFTGTAAEKPPTTIRAR